MKVTGTKPNLQTYNLKVCFDMHIMEPQCSRHILQPYQSNFSHCQVTAERVTCCVSAKESGTESSFVGEAGDGGKDI